MRLHAAGRRFGVPGNALLSRLLEEIYVQSRALHVLLQPSSNISMMVSSARGSESGIHANSPHPFRPQMSEVEGVLDLLGRRETELARRRDLNRRTCCWVAALAPRAVPDLEFAEAAKKGQA